MTTWQQPLKISVSHRSEFPVDSLPPVLRDFALHRADALQADPALTAVPSLTVAGAACGAAVARMNASWSEPAPIWTLTAADPGSRKSAALGAALAPLSAAEKQLADLDSETRPAKTVRVRRAEKAIKAAELRYEELLDDGDATDADIAVAAETVNTAAAECGCIAAEVGVPPKLNLGSFATSEKLHDMLAQYSNLAMTVAEGDTLFRRLGPRGTLDRDIFLQAWSMERHTRHLVGRAVPDADSPSLHFSIMVQPRVVAAVIGEDAILNDVGFFDRFLTAVPNTTQLQETEYLDLSDPNVFTAAFDSSPAMSAYRDTITREVHRTLPLRGRPTTWYLEAGAARLSKAFTDEWALYKKNYTTRSPGALSKLAGQAARLARLFSQLEMASDPASPATPQVFGGEVVHPLSLDYRYQITAANVRRGWEIAWWAFREHEYLFGDAHNDDVALADLARTVLRKARQFSDEGKTSFTVRELRRRGLGGHDTVAVAKAVQETANAGWVAAEVNGAQTIWHMHPELVSWVTKYDV